MQQQPSIQQPVVLSINSHDPSGGAGLVADVETVTSLGCHCLSAITALNVRDTQNHKDRQSTETALLIEQIRAALEDSAVDVIKVGDIATVAQAEAVHTILVEYGDIPVVLDPVLHHGAADGDVDMAVRMLLLPRATVAVLTTDHNNQLASCGANLGARVQELLEFGCSNLLVTGACSDGNKLINRLYSHRGISSEYAWDCLPQGFHGAGSTLSAALAAYLAHGATLPEALQQAQQFTWQALAHARRLGMGQLIPDRLFWSRRGTLRNRRR
jgi:hydroxymethylpyrimidine/phosphomethylpyrimidine kinase